LKTEPLRLPLLPHNIYFLYFSCELLDFESHDVLGPLSVPSRATIKSHGLVSYLHHVKCVATHSVIVADQVVADVTEDIMALTVSKQTRSAPAAKPTDSYSK
jgi:hypothetical protein